MEGDILLASVQNWDMTWLLCFALCCAFVILLAFKQCEYLLFCYDCL